MRDLENSVQINFSKFNSNQWNQLNEQFSQDGSHLHRPREATNSFFVQMMNEPPRPGNNLYACIENEQSGNSSIKEIPYASSEVQNKIIKHVNPKQYFRMLKIRIKKGMQKVMNGESSLESPEKKKKYLHESRHRHAMNRLRGKDGKFLATRPLQERVREKKKRGRKPKNFTNQPTETGQSATKNESASLKQV